MEEYVEAAAGGERKLFMSSNDLLEEAAKHPVDLFDDDADLNDRKDAKQHLKHHDFKKETDQDKLN